MLNPIKLLQIGLVFLKIPILFLVHVLMNIIKYLAPNFTFKIAMKFLERNLEVYSWVNAEQLCRPEDLQFLFSLDIIKVVRAQI